MSITWTEDADSRQNLGISGIQQQNSAAFSLSDYPSGGYPVYASAFGLSHIRSLIPVAYTGTALGLVFQYQKPAISGPAATNPGFIRVWNGSTEVSVSNNIIGGTVDFRASGY